MTITASRDNDDDDKTLGRSDKTERVQGVADSVFASIVSRVLGLRPGPDFLLWPTMNPGREEGRGCQDHVYTSVYRETCADNKSGFSEYTEKRTNGT